MFTKIGIIVFHVLAFLAFIAGVISFFQATNIPGGYYLSSASAVQVTQVYSEATFVMLRAIAYILIALFIEVAIYVGYPQPNSDLLAIKENTAATKNIVSRIGGMLQKSNRVK